MFYILGHDTTASAISWILYALADNPEHQEKARAEVDDLMDGRDVDNMTWCAAENNCSLLQWFFLNFK